MDRHTYQKFTAANTIQPVPPYPQDLTPAISGYSGVGKVLVDGSLGTCARIAGTNYALTAAHVVDDFSGPGGGTVTFENDGIPQTVDIVDAKLHPLYDGNGTFFSDIAWDVALIELSSFPATVQGYDLYAGTSEVGKNVLLVGYGRIGNQFGVNRDYDVFSKHIAFNTIDTVSLGSSSLVADFDSGQLVHSSSGGLGLGSFEGMAAPGDSGGPVFINDQIAGVMTAGLTTPFDIDSVVNSSVGEEFTSRSVSSAYSWITTESGFDTQFFNESFYLSGKVAQLNQNAVSGRTGWTVDELNGVLASVGLTAREHYDTYGYLEELNPSAHFKEDTYYASKAQQLNSNGAQGRADWTAQEVEAVIDGAGLSPLQHYSLYGIQEGISGISGLDFA